MTQPTPGSVPDWDAANPSENPDEFPTDGADTTTADDEDDPHAVDEDPELHIGEELLDPWDDAEALDWPTDDDEDQDR
jgi:hypothetical protein